MSLFRPVYRELTDRELTQIGMIKDKAEDLAVLINATQAGRHSALAKTKLEECVMWAVKGITE